MAYCGYYLCRKNFSVLMPFLKAEAGYSSEALANVLFVYSLAYAVGQWTMGVLADRVGARWTVAGGAMVSAFSSASIAWGWPLLPMQGLNGMMQAAGWPGVLKLTRDWFPLANRGVVMAWWGTHLVVGGFVATNVASAVVGGGWRRGAWVPAVLLSLVGIVFWLFARDGHADSTAVTERGVFRLSHRLMAIAAMYFFVKMTRYAFLFWLPLFMVERLRYAPQQAGYASSIFEVFGFLGALGAGYVSEKLAGGRRMEVGTFAMLGLAVCCASYPALSSLGGAWNLLATALVGAFTFGPDTLMAGPATQEAAPPGATARAGGFVNGVGSVGQILSPLLVGYVGKWLGWDAVFYVLAMAALTGAAVLGSEALGREWRKA